MRNVAETIGIDGNLLNQNFMLERFYTRIAKSRYRDNFIIKGGVLLANIIGIQNRYTRDLDSLVTGFEFSEKELLKIVGRICQINLGDHITFEITKISPIRDEDEYGGYRLKLIAHYFNMQVPIQLDISTGDPVTDEPINTVFTSILGDEEIELRTYNIETILAEKLQTLLARSIENTRMRDFYDIYSIYKLNGDEINYDVLSRAISQTAKYRSTPDIFHNYKEILDEIAIDQAMNKRWLRYLEENEYVSKLLFSECLKVALKLLSTCQIELTF